MSRGEAAARRPGIPVGRGRIALRANTGRTSFGRSADAAQGESVRHLDVVRAQAGEQPPQPGAQIATGYQSDAVELGLTSTVAPWRGGQTNSTVAYPHRTDLVRCMR